MVSYTRARAERSSPVQGRLHGEPERIVLVILGALFNHWGVMPGAVGVAMLSTITVAHRIIYTYRTPSI